MDLSKDYENLTKLYLRLRGCLVSNLLLHNEHGGGLRSELDVVAVRMPRHSQEYRSVNNDDYIGFSNDRINILIADVKTYNDAAKLKFNDGLRTRESVRQLIDWLGVFPVVDDVLVDNFLECLNAHRKKDWSDFPELKFENSFGKFVIKFTFFCPKLTAWNGGSVKYVHGAEILDFCWMCLNETVKIETCSRRYDFMRWNDLESYVRFFKGRVTKPNFAEFESYCGSL